MIEQLTGPELADAQLLYFTSSSLDAADENLFFISNASGSPNLYRQNLTTREVSQLTFYRDGYLKSYVYFDGRPYQGFGKASVALDEKNGIIYYLHGRDIHKLDHGCDVVLTQYPAQQMTAFCHVSADGKQLCVPTVDAAALWGNDPLPPNFDIDARVQAMHLSSYLHIYDTGTGKELQSIQVPDSWITHVQFSPADANYILYNHEWAGDCGIRRMWLWDNYQQRSIRLRDDTAGRRRDDWVCHEIWTPDGKQVIYHGKFANGNYFIGKLDPFAGSINEIALAADYTGYGHFTLGPEGVLVSDGYYCLPEHPGTHDHLSILSVDWDSKDLHRQTRLQLELPVLAPAPDL